MLRTLLSTFTTCMDALNFYLCRNRNRVIVDQMREAMHTPRDPNKNLANQTSFNPEHLKAMKALARMRETADRADMGYAAGFVTEDGHYYFTSNVDSDDPQQKAVQCLIDFSMNQRFDINQMHKQLRIIHTKDGVQLNITNENTHDD